MANRLRYSWCLMSLNKNNFFELFGLPVAFEIDKNTLKKSLLALQKQYHPDQASSDTIPTQMASLINHAFDTLNRDDTRASHLLSLAGVTCDLNASINDWDFLDEMLEYRMALDDTNNSEDLNQILADINAKKSAFNAKFSSSYHSQDWQKAISHAQKIQFLEKLTIDVEHKLTENLNTPDDDLYV